MDHKNLKRILNQSKWDKFYPIYLSLDFLDTIDLIKLLELDKESRKLFKKKVYRTIFYNFDMELTQKQRFQIWHTILEIVIMF